MPVSPNALLVYIYDHLIVRKVPGLAENSKVFVNKMRYFCIKLKIILRQLRV